MEEAPLMYSVRASIVLVVSVFTSPNIESNFSLNEMLVYIDSSTVLTIEFLFSLNI